MQAPNQESFRKWAIISLVLAAIGAGLSVYATTHHFNLVAAGSTDAFCNINDQFSCDDVAKSAYSKVFDIPLGIWGLGFFLAQLVLLALCLTKPEQSQDNISGQLGLTWIGGLASAVLIGISTFVIGKYCLNCIGIYAVCFAQLGVWYAFRSAIPFSFDPKSLGNGGMNSVIVVAIVVALFKFFGASLMPASQSTASKPRSDAQPETLDLSPIAANVKVDKSAYSGMGEDYRKGNDNAKVTIVEFADFQCPACKGAWELMKQLQKQYGEEVLIVFKNYPLDKNCNGSIQNQIHQYACEAATLARCAGAQGKFWEMANKLFEGQSSLNSENMAAWASMVGLSKEQIASCKASKDIAAKIADDVAQGNQLNINSTPTIFINGRQILGGRSVETIQAEIERILGS